jgi:ABC-type branched-subunit amino acid transport system substrate-binding protein
MSLSHRARRWAFTAAVAAGMVVASSTAASATSNSSANTRSRSANGSKLVEAVITAFTGPESFIGGVLSAGAYPAVYEINQAGGVLGHDFAVTTVDTRGDPADALPLVERFLGSTSNLVGVCGTDGATANQLLPLINQHKLTMISDVGSDNFDHTHLQYFWRLVSPDPANGLAMAEWAKQKGYKRVALVFGTDTTAQGDLPGIEYGVKHLGLDAVANISLTPDQPSYQSDAATLLAAHPQAIFTEEDATTAGTFFGDVAQLGTVPPIIGDSGTIENSWLGAVSAAIGPSTFSADYTGLTPAPAKTTPAHAAWVSAVKGAASHVLHPANQWFNEPYAEAEYDGLIMQALAMVASKSTVPSVFNNYIESVSEPGPGKVTVYNFAAGKAALLAGKKIRYVGVSGPIAFNQWHNYYGNQAAVRFPQASLSSEKVVGTVLAKVIEAAG